MIRLREISKHFYQDERIKTKLNYANDPTCLLLELIIDSKINTNKRELYKHNEIYKEVMGDRLP